MTRHAALVAVTGLVVVTAVRPAAAPERTAAALVASVVQAQRTDGFILRGRLVVSRGARNEKPAVMQVRLAGRRDGERFRTLVQVLWPDRVKGTAVYFERGADGSRRGFGFTPPADEWPLEGEALGRRFAGSDLRIEDVLDDFLRWPNHALVGDDKVDGDPCALVESRPAADARNAATVRCCISERKRLVLRVERLDDRRRVVRRMTVERSRRGPSGRWVAVAMRFDTPGSEGSTLVELTRAERDVTVPADWFSRESIRHLAQDRDP